MEPSHEPATCPALIVGCGYLGSELAKRLLAERRTVYATTRTQAKARQLAGLGLRPMLVHVTQPVTLAAIRPALQEPLLDVFYMVPPGRPGRSPSPRQVVLGGIAHMVKTLRQANVRKAVLVSSTAVYGQQGGCHVDADTPPDPIDERGKLLLEGEKLWLAAGEQYHVVRLAGIYGPNRIVGLRAVRENAPLVGNPANLLNLIHVHDAAELLLCVAAAPEAGRVELGCDGHPVQRGEYYDYLAKQLGVAPPRVLDDLAAAFELGLNISRLKRASSKALDNIRTCQRTGWTPQYPNFRVGLSTLLNPATA